jgi:DAPG hydrolase PhiG domain
MDTYIGYRSTDERQPWAKYFDPVMQPIQAHAAAGLAQSPYQAGQLNGLERANELQLTDYQPVENGYALEADGSLRIAIRTDMPQLQPAMWDWWFGWHGSEASRYKLWHPKAHQHAVWKDGRADVAYVGRTSLIEEYIGASMEKASIRFVDPTELGLPPNSARQVHICARLGYRDYPIDFGWLIHQVRATPTGAEMRSRFWVGGPHIESRRKGWVPRMVVKALAAIIRLPARRGHDLMEHCAAEMHHLAQRLPAIYHEFA